MYKLRCVRILDHSLVLNDFEQSLEENKTNFMSRKCLRFGDGARL